MEHKIATILIVPKALLREGLASLLSNTAYKPIKSVSYIAELDHGASLEKELFIVSRDALTRPGGDGLLPELARLRREHTESKVLVLSDSFNFADALAALRAGANGYLINTLTSSTLIKSLDLVMLGETVLSSEFAQAVSNDDGLTAGIIVPPANAIAMLRLEDCDPLWPLAEPISMPDLEDDDALWNHPDYAETHQLSRRETAILLRLIQGDSNKNIARGIGVAEATVKTHIKAILRKIRVKNRTQAAMWAYTNLRESHDSDIHVGTANGDGAAKHAKYGR